MASLNEIAYNILNIFRGGRSQHNEHYSLDQIKFNIKYYRTLFIRRDLQRFTKLEPFEQSLSNVKFNQINRGDLGLGDQYTLVSETIPTPMRLKNREGITFVGRQDDSKGFPIVTYNQSRYQKFNKFTSSEDNNRSFYKDNKLYIVGPIAKNVNNSLDIDSVDLLVRGIFRDPEDVVVYNTGEYSHDDQFPSMPNDYIQRIVQGIASQELMIMSSTLSDFKHDNRPPPPNTPQDTPQNTQEE